LGCGFPVLFHTPVPFGLDPHLSAPSKTNSLAPPAGRDASHTYGHVPRVSLKFPADAAGLLWHASCGILPRTPFFERSAWGVGLLFKEGLGLRLLTTIFFFGPFPHTFLLLSPPKPPNHKTRFVQFLPNHTVSYAFSPLWTPQNFRFFLSFGYKPSVQPPENPGSFDLFWFSLLVVVPLFVGLENLVLPGVSLASASVFQHPDSLCGGAGSRCPPSPPPLVASSLFRFRRGGGLHTNFHWPFLSSGSLSLVFAGGRVTSVPSSPRENFFPSSLGPPAPNHNERAQTRLRFPFFWFPPF